MENFLYENSRGSPTWTMLNILNVLKTPKDPSLACWALFFFRWSKKSFCAVVSWGWNWRERNEFESRKSGLITRDYFFATMNVESADIRRRKRLLFLSSLPLTRRKKEADQKKKKKHLGRPKFASKRMVINLLVTRGRGSDASRLSPF